MCRQETLKVGQPRKEERQGGCRVPPRGRKRRKIRKRRKVGAFVSTKCHDRGKDRETEGRKEGYPRRPGPFMSPPFL
jgi:hypothetical protein